ncbi:MAG: hypothetical protein AB1664_00720 [Thermodesulfobacteriota bacterium]
MQKMNAAGGQAASGANVKCNYPGCDFVGRSSAAVDEHFRLAHSEEHIPAASPSPKAPEGQRAIVYVARRPQRRTIKSSKSIVVANGMGTPTRMQTEAALKCDFTDAKGDGKGYFILTEEFARQHGRTFEEVKELIENDIDFRTGLITVGGPVGEPVQKGPKLISGARSI